MNSIITLPAWVKEATKMPVYFSQVREDSSIDLAVARLLGKDLKVIMIASGGCTAAALAGSGLISALHIVDMNASQLALTKLKLELLNRANKQERLNILGYTKTNPRTNGYCLDTWLNEIGLDHEIFGDKQMINLLGLDFSGRYEQVFVQLRKELHPYEEDLAHLLGLSDPQKQNNYIRQTTALVNALAEAFEKVMALANLTALFGEAATRNRRNSFAEHFFERTLNILNTQPANTNPYLQSVLSHQEPRNIFCPWIEMSAPDRMPSLSFLEGSMLNSLSQSQCKYDIIHLSNICDWLERDEAKELLIKCHSKLNSGGMVVIRQLNSTLDIPSLSTQFDWQTKLSKKLLSMDRSFFYHSIHVGLKP